MFNKYDYFNICQLENKHYEKAHTSFFHLYKKNSAFSLNPSIMNFFCAPGTNEPEEIKRNHLTALTFTRTPFYLKTPIHAFLLCPLNKRTWRKDRHHLTALIPEAPANSVLPEEISSTQHANSCERRDDLFAAMSRVTFLRQFIVLRSANKT